MLRHLQNATVTVIHTTARLHRRLCLLIVLPLLCECLGPVVAQDLPRQLQHFEVSIRPLLLTHCVECHGANRQESGLRLDTRQGWEKGGDRGPAVVPGRPEESLLMQAVRHTDPDLAMPQQRLSDQEIAALAQWIRDGAIDPREISDGGPSPMRADPRTFWSFQPVREPAIPQVSQPGWVRTPVDAFVLAHLDAQGLQPAPRADARTLVRRVCYDLLGLPPAPEQIAAFERDPSQAAWERLIDQLLQSPQYGERWGRHWLDVARYADSGGFETDIYYRNAWRYRDYVVQSFNTDKPFDVFVQEQIAGDELWPDDLTLQGNYTIAPEKLRHLEALTGTGLYTLGPQVHESNMDGRKIRYETLSDWVDTTGAAFLGLTFSCARCHDHKFDPISQQDYYGLQAIFADSRELEYPIVDAMGIADFKQHYPRIIAVDEARRAVRLFDAQKAGRPLTPEEQNERRNLLTAIAEKVLALPENTALGVPFAGLMELPTVSGLGHERPELVTPVHLLHRGELSRPRQEVTPALPEALRVASQWNTPLPGRFRNRAALAHWLTSPQHPLTARVMVNRIWHGHFGRGIVGSLNDFGLMGERPTHPELLDWLAHTFMQRGWSIREIHRLILRSSTWQMESRERDTAAEAADPQNRSLRRMNRRRLEAEALWDSLHSVAGTLNLKSGGRPVVPPLGADEGPPGSWIVTADPAEHTRRGLYVLQRRNFRFPMFDVFDLPVNAVTAPARDVTTVAPQALWLMNNPVALRQARALSERLAREARAGWNLPDFGPGQSGWVGGKSGIHAGWARREDNGQPTELLDDPTGTVITHGPTSVAWQVPSNCAGGIQIAGELWNLRRLGRKGPWKLWLNEQLLTEGMLEDSSGTSSRPLPLSLGTGGPASLRPMVEAGDLLRLEILEDDFVGIRLTIETTQGPRDIATDFSLDANPTTTGWRYCESMAQGGLPLTTVVKAPRDGVETFCIQRAWQLALGRLPTDIEVHEARTLLTSLSTTDPESAMPLLCLAIFNLQEFMYVD